MNRTSWRRWLAIVVIYSLLASNSISLAGGIRVAGQKKDDVWPPPFYAYCVGLPQTKNPSIREQTRMLHDIGFDGVGYPLWLDQNLDKNLQMIDEAQLKLFLMYTTINLKANTPMYDPRLPDAIRKLKGRPVTVCVLLRGLPPGDSAGNEPAIRALRTLGDIAAKTGVRISIYHHTGDWTETFAQALRIAEKTDHPQVGVNFNLCHWLKVDGDKDYRPLLRKHIARVFAVTINGAQRGADTWTNGLIQPLDRGNFDNRELLKTLREAGYRGPIGLMCYGLPGDPRESLERSMKVWRGEALW